MTTKLTPLQIVRGGEPHTGNIKYLLDLSANFPTLSPRSASIYQSTFRKTDPGWTLVSRPILVADNAKRQSPLAAVTWANGLKVRHTAHVRCRRKVSMYLLKSNLHDTGGGVLS